MGDATLCKDLDQWAIGHGLARRSGMDLTRARKGIVRLWKARGLG